MLLLLGSYTPISVPHSLFQTDQHADEGQQTDLRQHKPIQICMYNALQPDPIKGLHTIPMLGLHSDLNYIQSCLIYQTRHNQIRVTVKVRSDLESARFEPTTRLLTGCEANKLPPLPSWRNEIVILRIITMKMLECRVQ